jgi:8-oxo-dGTP diphosphatase
MKDVTAALIVNSGKVFIAKRMIGQHLGNKWEFPGGKVEPGESPEDCLKRELFEELGVDATVSQFFMESVHQYNKGTIRLLAYFISDVIGDYIPTAHEEIQWVEIEDLLDYDLAPADIPIAEGLIQYYQGVSNAAY